MVRRSQNRVQIRISGVFLIMLSLMLLVLPLQWIGAALLAGLIHELCHAAAVFLCGGDIYSFRIGTGGATMEIQPMHPWQELLCALAGPLGGLLLLPLGKWLPRTVLCAAFHSLYNLLPVYPLDGGRALRCGAEILLSEENADRFCRLTENCICVTLLALGLYEAVVWKIGLLPALLAAAVLIRIRHTRKNRGDNFTVTQKITCKPGEQRVQ